MSNNLNISSRGVRLTIDNDENRVIEFFPTDVAFAEGFFALASEFANKQEEIKKQSEEIQRGTGTSIDKHMAEIALTREAFKVLRNGIDNVFGPGTAQTVFGNRDTLDMVARFFRGVEPYIRKARQEEIDRYLKDVDGGVMEA